MFSHGSVFNPEKNVHTGINIFLFGGAFGVFLAKIIISMPRVLVLSIKFLFHSISGWKRTLIFGFVFYTSYTKEVLLGFLPLEGFHCVYIMIVFLSLILDMLLLLFLN